MAIVEIPQNFLFLMQGHCVEAVDKHPFYTETPVSCLGFEQNSSMVCHKDVTWP